MLIQAHASHSRLQIPNARQNGEKRANRRLLTRLLGALDVLDDDDARFGALGALTFGALKRLRHGMSNGTISL